MLHLSPLGLELVSWIEEAIEFVSECQMVLLLVCFLESSQSVLVNLTLLRQSFLRFKKSVEVLPVLEEKVLSFAVYFFGGVLVNCTGLALEKLRVLL